MKSIKVNQNIHYHDLNLIEDFYQGNVKTHIIKWYKEDLGKYQWRVDVSYYQNYIKPIVDGLTGMLFNKKHNIKIKDELYLNNIDLIGTPLLKFMQQCVKNAILDGLTLIIADTNNNNKIPNPRGYLKNYKYKALISYKIDNISGKLKQIVLKDTISIDKNEFEVEHKDIYIRYMIGGGEIYIDDNKSVKLLSSWSNNLDYIPISVLYGSLDSSGLEASSIVLPLAKLNKTHLNLKSGLMNISHIASNPTPVLWGETLNQHLDNDLTIGVNDVIMFPTNQEHAYDFQWREIKGTSIAVAEREIKELENYIISSSFNILKVENFTTATEAKIKYHKNKSILTFIADSLESAINNALLNLEELTKSKILDEITINKDFDNLIIDANTIANLIKLKDTNNISIETLWNALIKGEVIEINDFNLEKDRILNDLERGL
jgi:hypothetical protein